MSASYISDNIIRFKRITSDKMMKLLIIDNCQKEFPTHLIE